MNYFYSFYSNCNIQVMIIREDSYKLFHHYFLKTENYTKSLKKINLEVQEVKTERTQYNYGTEEKKNL